jgi:membrane-associated phospholipid phosphatase
MLKSLNNEPRPFFVSDLKPYKCRLEHGNPSGHTLIVVALYATLVEALIREYPSLRRNKIKVWSIYVLVAGFIGFGRIYNGVHTHN